MRNFKNYFLRNPKQQTLTSISCGKKNIDNVWDPRSYRYFFRLAVNGEEKFSLHISSLCNFPLQVHFHTHARFMTFLLKTKKPHGVRKTPHTPRNAPNSHGWELRFPGGALMGMCWDWCCICSTYPFVENPYIIRPAGTSESQTTMQHLHNNIWAHDGC